MKTLNAKSLIAALAGAAAVTAVAAPAAAQPYRGDQGRYERNWDNDRHEYRRGHEYERRHERRTRHDDGVNARQANLEHRIHDAARQGRLTRGEFRELRRDLHSIGRLEANYRSDGWLDRREQAELHRRLAWSERRFATRVQNDRYARW